MENWSNYGGYGFWCDRACAEAKAKAGIPPLGSRRGTKQTQAEAEKELAQAAKEQAGKTQGWSPLAVVGVVAGSMLAISLLAVIVIRARKRK